MFKYNLIYLNLFKQIYIYLSRLNIYKYSVGGTSWPTVAFLAVGLFYPLCGERASRAST